MSSFDLIMKHNPPVHHLTHNPVLLSIRLHPPIHSPEGDEVLEGRGKAVLGQAGCRIVHNLLELVERRAPDPVRKLTCTGRAR